MQDASVKVNIPDSQQPAINNDFWLNDDSHLNQENTGFDSFDSLPSNHTQNLSHATFESSDNSLNGIEIYFLI